MWQRPTLLLVGSFLLVALTCACNEDLGRAPRPPSSISLDPGAPGAAPRVPFGGGVGPGSQVTWLAYAKQKSYTDPGDMGAVLMDIETHLPSSYGTQYQDADRITWGHETTHGINSELRNNYNKTGKTANGFYCLESQGAIIEEPNLRKSQVAAFVPQVLRGSRFELYINGMSDWDDTPTYIFDEWTAKM